jgi:hypothetical protein
MNRQNDNFYWGTRYEYATTLALSSIASAIQIPRPEDYGFDHICTLVEVIGNNRYPRISFGVQVKPEDKDMIVYGDINKNGELQDWEVEWLFNRDLPLIIATVNLVPSFCLKLYSTWSVWHAYWMRPDFNKRKVNIHINQQPELPNNVFDRWKSYPHDSSSIETYDNCDVYLGQPICEMKSPTPEIDESTKLYECLSFWINLDKLNIQYRKLGIPIMYTVQDWVTNEKPNFSPYQYAFKPKGIKQENLLQTLAPMIWSLENTFKEQSDTENQNRLNGINEIIENRGYKLQIVC